MQTKSLRTQTVMDASYVESFMTGRRVKQKKGQLYCFTPKASDSVYKFGRSDNWAKRKKSYAGFNKPKKILFVVEVDDQRAMEKVMLDLLNESAQFFKREDLGDEWFESSLAPEEVKRVVLAAIRL